MRSVNVPLQRNRLNSRHYGISEQTSYGLPHGKQSNNNKKLWSQHCCFLERAVMESFTFSKWTGRRNQCITSVCLQHSRVYLKPWQPQRWGGERRCISSKFCLTVKMTFNNRDKSSSGKLFSFQHNDPNWALELDGNGDAISKKCGSVQQRQRYLGLWLHHYTYNDIQLRQHPVPQPRLISRKKVEKKWR